MTEDQPSPSQVYGVVRDELIGALAGIGDDAAMQAVPSCSAWTVKDVAAHLCGLNAEFIAEVQGGLGSDEATTRQVGDRASANLDQVLREWQSLAPEIEQRLDANETMATALLADLVIHVFDLEEVLEQSTTEATRATPRSAHRYIPLLQERVAEKAAAALTIELTDGTTWPAKAASGAAAVTVRTDPHSFLRGVSGRLTRNQVAAFDWSADPTEILDRAWNQYGPFRT